MFYGRFYGSLKITLLVAGLFLVKVYYPLCYD